MQGTELNLLLAQLSLAQQVGMDPMTGRRQPSHPELRVSHGRGYGKVRCTPGLRDVRDPPRGEEGKPGSQGRGQDATTGTRCSEMRSWECGLSAHGWSGDLRQLASIDVLSMKIINKQSIERIEKSRI